MEFGETVEAARTAYAAQNIAQAVALYAEADRAGHLEPSDLYDFGWAGWIRGEVGEAPDRFERAFEGFLTRAEKQHAAAVALDLTRMHGGSRRQAVAQGWFRKAESLLADAPESAEHGMLALMRAFLAQMQGQLDEALGFADQALAIASRHHNPDVQALALNRKGRLLIKLGQVAQGRALLDEAMVAAVGGELSLFFTGLVYCSTIDACADLQDFGRASDWTDAARRWCERKSISGFPGICRVHQAEISRLRGAWPEAAEQAQKAVEELEQYSILTHVGPAYGELGAVRLRAGDLDLAEQAFNQAEQLGHEPEPGRSLLRLARGNIKSARSSIERALDERKDSLGRVRLLPAAVEIAIAAGELDRARQYGEEISAIAKRFESQAFAAAADEAMGTVALAANEAAGAIEGLRAAVRAWQTLNLPYEAARARVLLGRAYRAAGDEEGAVAELGAAKTAFEKLGARLDARKAAEMLTPKASPSERHTFMFTDIVGSTSLAEALGDSAWTELLRWHDEALRAEFAQHAGEEVKRTGDGFLVTFEEPRAALACAMSIQRRLAAHRRDHGFAPQVRIGVHAAVAAWTGADFAGVGVHEAARIAAVAGASEIVASWATCQAAGEGFPFEPPRSVTLKGIAAAVEVATIRWTPSDAA